MENYIVINGKKAELTDDQLKQLGIIIKKEGPFDRVNLSGTYYFIDPNGKVYQSTDCGVLYDDYRYVVANYCTDFDLIQQRAWHETLSRLLWRYSMEHDGGKIDWGNFTEPKYYIHKQCLPNRFCIGITTTKSESTHFYTREAAMSAIEEVIRPFMKDHPEFVW